MNQGEKKFWEYLGPKLRPYGHFERIESHETAIGTPDVNYCINGYCNHLELKYTDSEKKGLRLRPSQSRWFRDRVKSKGQPWLLTHINIRKKRGYILIPGVHVPKLVHTTRVTDWMEAGVAAWEDKLNLDDLVNFLSTYLVTVPDPSLSGTSKKDASVLILPSNKLMS